MKLTRENYELLMFDLLEGNIPEKNQVELKEQILQDEFYRSEWELFQSTVLIPDHSVVYEHKHALKKKETTILPMTAWMSIAVAACVIFALFIYLPGKETGNNPSTVKLPAPVQEKENNTLINPIKAPERLVSKNEDTPKTGTNMPAVIAPSAESTVPVASENRKALRVPDSRLVAHTAPSSFSSQLTEFAFSPTKNKEISYIQQDVVTNTPAERISGIIAQTRARMRNPKLNIKPDWKKKELDIEFETEGYYALARFTPFKK